jgi:ATP-dependent RNA helicase DeaD
MQGLVEQYRQEHDVPAVEIAAALAKISIGEKSMLLSPDKDRGQSRDKGKSRKQPLRDVDAGAERYRIEVGHVHGVKPGNIVGAIANEAGLDGEHIGQIEIEAEFSLVDLPAGMPKDVFMDLKKVRVCGQPMNISRQGESGAPRKRKGKPITRGMHKGKPKPRNKAKTNPKNKAKPGAKAKPKPAVRKKKRKKPGT